MENNELIDQIGAIVLLVVILVAIVILFVYESRKECGRRKAKRFLKATKPQEYQIYLNTEDEIKILTTSYMYEKDKKSNERN